LYLESVEIGSLRDSLQIQVLPESILKKVFVSIKTTEKTLIPRRSIWVETIDLTLNVDKAQNTYQLTDTSFVSLAHVLAATYKNTELENEWAFRHDAEGGSELYLWRVPEIEEGSIVYHFGYGGSRTSDTHRKTWVVMLNQQAYVSGFDKIKVNNDDEILVYQIPDNQSSWSVTEITANSDSLMLNQKIELQLIKYFCSMNQDRSISINLSEVLAFHPVQIGLENSTQNGTIYTTDELGKLSVTFDKVGEYLIVSGIDASKLFVGSTTGNKDYLANNLPCKVYPNPFTDYLRIECTSPHQSVEIVDLHGSTVYSELNSPAEIRLHHLPSGFYILKVKSGKQIFQQKLIKL
jgi:hypothetical protein